jgi:hypothetical protein
MTYLNLGLLNTKLAVQERGWMQIALALAPD